jgi:hypothetical protein
MQQVNTLTLVGTQPSRLTKAVEIAMNPEVDNVLKPRSFTFSREDGLILFSEKEAGANVFRSPVNSGDIAEMAREWLKTEDASNVSYEQWEKEGVDRDGWKVYCGANHRVGNYSNVICAIRPTQVC